MGPWGNLCGAQGEFCFQPKERRFQPMERKKKSGQMNVFDGSSTVGSGSSFQVPSLPGPVTSQEPVPAAKAVRGLELCLKVRERERFHDSGVVDSCRVSNSGRRCRVPLLRSNYAGGGVGFAPDDVAISAGERGGQDSRADFGNDIEGVRSSTAGESAGIVRLREFESARATAGERSGGFGLLEVTESDFPSLSYPVDSCLGLSTSACARASRVARAVAAARVCPVSSSSAESAVVHAHATTLHGAHNSGGTGGLLPVQTVTAWIIRGRTRLGHRVPPAQRGSEVGFPVRPKICVLSQRWRQG